MVWPQLKMKIIIVVIPALLLASYVLSAKFCDNKEDGKYAIPGNCTQYWNCTRHETRNMTCPRGQKFNGNKRQCVAGICLNGFCDNRADGNYPIPGNCTHFHKCTNHKTLNLTCPRGQKFDGNKRQCVLGNCFNSVSGFCKNKADGQYPIPGNCTHFYKCTGQKSQNVTCPPGQKFDGSKRQCVVGFCFNEFCSNRTNGNYPIPGNCSHFYKCTDRQTQNVPCPRGQKFDEIRRQCVFGNCLVQTSAKGFCDNKADRKYPVPSNCTQYWKCANHKTQKLTCPRGQKFDGHKRQCIVGKCTVSGFLFQ